MSVRAPFIPVILCGGAGSRLWPLSREATPKPLLPLFAGESLLQQTLARVSQLPDVTATLTIARRELLFAIKDQYSATCAAKNLPARPQHFVLEPFGRNTAPALAAALVALEAEYAPETCVLVTPADHLISDQAAFAEAVAQARQAAQQGQLVTFGIVPTKPATGYGYIEYRDGQVVRFVEKPNQARAAAMLASGDFFWNAGIFCMTLASLRQALASHAPAVLAAASAALAATTPAVSAAGWQYELPAASWEKSPDISIDYAIMEKAQNLAMVPATFPWNDVGSFDVLAALAPRDAQGNAMQGGHEVITTNSHNNFVHAESRLVGLAGVDDLLVVDTADALLITKPSAAQQVRVLYDQLKAKGHAAHQLHQTVHRPWGTYTVLEEGPGFKIKRIEVKPGAALSLQLHHHRSEHWVVVSGVARVTNGAQVLELQTNQSTYISAETKHRLENATTTPLVMIEVQCGGYLGEDDIVRFADVYGRNAA